MFKKKCLAGTACFILFSLLVGCGQSSTPSEKTTEEVVKKAQGAGGKEGLDILNKEIKDLEEKIDKKNSEYRRIKKRLNDREDELTDVGKELKEKEDRLREIEDQLNTGNLNPAEEKALRDERDALQTRLGELRTQRDNLQTQIDTLTSDKTRLEREKNQAQTELASMRQARDDLQKQLNIALEERNTARNERDNEKAGRTNAERETACWKKTRGNFCDRAEAVQTAVLAQISDVSECNNINYCHLETIINLDLSGGYDPASPDCDDHLLRLKPSDFVGFVKLETLSLKGKCVKGLKSYTASEGFFSGLTKIRVIDLMDTAVVKLSADFFNGVLDTLEEVKITDFVYCSNPNPPYLSKLSDNKFDDGGVSGYCY